MSGGAKQHAAPVVVQPQQAGSGTDPNTADRPPPNIAASSQNSSGSANQGDVPALPEPVNSQPKSNRVGNAGNSSPDVVLLLSARSESNNQEINSAMQPEGTSHSPSRDGNNPASPIIGEFREVLRPIVIPARQVIERVVEYLTLELRQDSTQINLLQVMTL